VSRRAAWLSAVAVLVVLGWIAWRPLSAWWLDDAGNRALLRGQNANAERDFEAALGKEPGWAILHEDLGRAIVASDPARALQEFERANCGSPCMAEAGDALMAMGRTREAIDRYVQAKAVGKVSDVASQLVASQQYDEALAIESALLARLHDDFVDRSELAAVYAQIGKIDIAAASRVNDPRAARVRAEKGIASLAHAKDLAPLNEDYLLSYGFAQLRFGSADEARRTFERILELHPGQKDAVDALARMEKPNAP
jgi:tetratricopeptide (TPR) repeat protein